MLATLLVYKMYDYRGFYGVDINPERMPAERGIVLSMNALKVGAAVVNQLDFEALVETMYSPAENRGLVEDVLMKTLAPRYVKLKTIPG
jgi:xylose isomerase